MIRAELAQFVIQVKLYNIGIIVYELAYNKNGLARLIKGLDTIRAYVHLSRHK